MTVAVPRTAPSHFAWLVRLRWGAIASQALTIGLVQVGLGLELALGELFAIVSLTALSNAVCEWWLRRRRTVSDGAIAAIMALDFVLLTDLLRAAGGPSNPFSVLYLVHVALSAAILRPAFAWALAALSTALFGLLFLLPTRHDAVLHAMGMHDHAAGSSMNLHFQGMWVAFAIAAFVIVYFVTRITRDLEEARELAAEARARALRSEKLASLATLSAGAAHELGTPLSTIAVAARELERSLSTGTLHEDALLDVRAVRDEVERCRSILAQMASDAGEHAGEAFERTDAQELVAQVLDGLAQRERVAVALRCDGGLEVPRRALAQALRALVKNALEASTGPVELSLASAGGAVQVEVRDHGAGMPPDVLARIGEPFYTTKPTGRGMGLGVFLARVVLEQLGGELRYESAPKEGTRAFGSFRAALSERPAWDKVGRP